MRRLLLLFALLIIAVWIGLRINADPGYLLLKYQHWTIETTLWVGILIALIGFLVLYFLLRLFAHTKSLAGRIRNFFGRYRNRRSQKLTSRGLIELTEGKWQAAEKHLLQATTSGEAALINYLAAARAAQEQGASARRDEYLQKAQNATPDAKVAVELTQAQLQLSEGQLEQALASLRHLQGLSPKHPYVLKLLKQLYVQLNDWQSLIRLLPQLRRTNQLSAEELADTEQQAYNGVLQTAVKTDVIELRAAWEEFPRHIRKQPIIIATYAQGLLQHGEDETAQLLLAQTLKKHSDDTLIELYGLATGKDTKKQLQIAEGWLNKQKENPTLLLALGRLCLHNQLWGKARTYFENSVALAPKAETYMELGKLLEQLDLPEQALQNYRAGLALTVET